MSLLNQGSDDPEHASTTEPSSFLPKGKLRWLVGLAPLIGGLVALAASYLIAPTFTSTVTFLPPQQQQGAAAAALASLGSLANLAGGAAGLRTSGDQYAALMQSDTLSDRIIEHYSLMAAYRAEFRVEAREELKRRVRIDIGKRDGMVRVEVDDEIPQRAADIANRYVEELRDTTASIALTEAQQRRKFFEELLSQTRDKLAQAQRALQSSGFTAGALRAEPKASAESYARLSAEVTAAEVKLQTLRGSLSDDTPEVRQQSTMLTALRSQLARLEQSEPPNTSTDYIGKYREFKYQETLFELYARQFELARADEARDGGLIQVIDVAKAAERKSKPRRGFIALTATASVAALLVMLLAWRAWRQRSATDAADLAQAARLRMALDRPR